MASKIAATAPAADAPLSSRQRQAPTQNAQDARIIHASDNRPLVAITKEGLAELRSRIATVAQETVEDKVWARAGADSTKRRRRKGRALDPATLAGVEPYLTRFQEMVLSKIASMCDVKGVEAQHEADELSMQIEQLFAHSRHTIARLNATRARVARLGLETCSDALRISKLAEDRKAELLAKSGGDCGGSGGGDGNGQGAQHSEFCGMEAGVLEPALEPKVSMLIGAIAELPGPLKAVLQELPELTSSLSKTVRSVQAAIGVGESRTEALLGKVPPAPLGNRGGQRGAGLGPGGEGHGAEGHKPPEIARATARERRAKEARLQREAGGAGMLGEIMNT